MHTFNEQSIVVDYISNFLYKYWLPIYDTAQPGDYLVKNNLYVYDNMLVFCERSGFIGGENYNTPAELATYGYAKIKTLFHYKLGGKYLRSSDNYVNNSEYYDVDLHRRLGKFVRCYSDIVGTDLRPYYNCNCEKYITNIYIEKIQNEKSIDEFQLFDGQSSYSVLLVPIRFNHTYTIACDCPAQVTIMPVFYSQDRKLIISEVSGDRDISTEFYEKTKQLWLKQFMSYTNPIEVQVECKGEIADKYYRYQDNLYLLMQFPRKNRSSITVLEGKYRNPTRKNIVNVPNLEDLSEYQLNRVFTSKNSLLQMDSEVSIPYSNRLIEYLFDNVIDYTWKLDGNIEKMQQLLPNGRMDYFDGIWDHITRYKLYEFNRDYAKTNKLDYCGHLDKETERALLKMSSNINGGF